MTQCQPAEEPEYSAGTSFEQILAAYLDSTDGGLAPSRSTLLERHAEHAAGLRDYFDAVDCVAQLFRRAGAEEMRPTARFLGHYELLEEIGAGGMGTVFRARDTRLDRDVALKQIRGGLWHSPTELARFRNEAGASSQLDHPRIVPVYDLGEHEGRLFFTMKLIEGENLAEWRRLRCEVAGGMRCDRSLQRQLAGIVMQAAAGIHHAHQRGVLHRDLKPSNVLVDRQGQPWIVDFGLAKLMNGQHEITQTGAVLGTPAYMAPEQTLPLLDHAARQEPGHCATATTATGVYGLGAILYFLLTGQPPFRGESALATVALVRNEPLRPVGVLNPAVDPDLDAICQKCLQKEPGLRYESADALVRDLSRWLAGEPTLARPPGVWQRACHWCWRNRLIAGLSLVMCGLAVFGVAALAYGLISTQTARNDAVRQRQTALSNLRAVIQEINDLENRRPDLDEMRLDLLLRIQRQLEPMLRDPVHGSLADETNFWLEIDAGDVHEMREERDEASRHFERALEIVRQIPQDPDGRQQRMLSFALSHMGDSESIQFRQAAASDYYRQCLAIRQTLAAAVPGPQSQADLGLAHLKLSTGLNRLHLDTGDADVLNQSVENARAAVPIFEQLTLEQPESVWHPRFLAYARESIADGLQRTLNCAEAIEQCRRGVEELQNAQLRLPDYRLILDVHAANLLDVQSAACLTCGRFEEGRQAGLGALSLRQRLSELSPQAVYLRRAMLWSRDRLGQNEQGLDLIDEATRTFEQSLELGEQLLLEVPGSYNILADTCHNLDHLIFMLVARPECDDRTLPLYEKRTAFRAEDLQAHPSDADRREIYFQHLLQYAELRLIRGERELASELLEEAGRLISPRAALPDPARGQRQLSSHRSLLDAMRAGETSGLLEIAEQTESRGILMRLQNLFVARADGASLAIVSTRLLERSATFFQEYAGTQGLAISWTLLPPGEERERVRSQVGDRLQRLKRFGSHVADRTAADPVFDAIQPPVL